MGARDELEAVIETAVARGKTWGALTGAERAVVLHVAGLRLEARSAEVLEAMASECGKTLYQRAPTHGDYNRAQKTRRALETKYRLEELSTVHATRL